MDSEKSAPSTGPLPENGDVNQGRIFSLEGLQGILTSTSATGLTENGNAPVVSNAHSGSEENRVFLPEDISLRQYVEKGTQYEEAEGTSARNDQDGPLDLSAEKTNAPNFENAPAVPAGLALACAKPGVRFTFEEQKALLKAIAWMGMLHQRIDALNFEQLRFQMRSGKYWIDNFKGNGSLVQKFCTEMGSQVYQRSFLSLKRKWENCVAAIKDPQKRFFDLQAGISGDERKFLESLAGAY